jgi:hypothetical protein
MMAKVDVAFGTALKDADTHELLKVHLYNAVKQGQVIPNLPLSINTPSVPAGATRLSTAYPFATAATDRTQLKGEIYIFEAPKGSGPANPTAFQQNTCLVLEIKDKGTGRVGFYRLDFADDSGEYLPILRNHVYNFTIDGVEGPGHDTVDLAQESTNNDLDTKLTDWDNTGITDIVTNGLYSLGISRKEVTLEMDAYTTASTGNDLRVVSSHPGGWLLVGAYDNLTYSPGSKVVQGGTPCGWLQVSQTSWADDDAPAGHDFKILTSTNSGTTPRVGYLIFETPATVVGTHSDLQQIVKVTQNPAWIRIIDVITGAEVTEWLFAAKNPTPRYFKLEWPPVEDGVTSTNTPGTTPLSWAAESSLPPTASGGSLIFLVDPAEITDAEIAADYKIKKEATLGFALGTATRSLALVQQNPYLEVTPATLEFPYGGGSQTMTINTNVAGGWSVGGTLPSWLHVDTSTGTVTADATVADRTATITITAGTLTKTVNVRQLSFYINTNPESLIFAFNANNMTALQNVDVTTNVNWTIISKPNWISTNVLTGTGDGTLVIWPNSKNGSPSARNGEIVLKGSGCTKTIAVAQNALPYIIIRRVDYTQGTKLPDNVEVTSILVEVEILSGAGFKAVKHEGKTLITTPMGTGPEGGVMYRYEINWSMSLDYSSLSPNSSIKADVIVGGNNIMQFIFSRRPWYTYLEGQGSYHALNATAVPVYEMNSSNIFIPAYSYTSL